MIHRQAGFKKRRKGKDSLITDEDNSGFVDAALQGLDLECEWDPEKHDRQMAELFDRDAEAFEDEGECEGLRFDEDGKPIWDDNTEISDTALPDDNALPNESRRKEKKRKKKKEKGKDDGGVDVDAMDADAELNFEEDEEWDGTEEMRKRVLKRYMAELDALDFNDVVRHFFPNRCIMKTCSIVLSKYRLATFLRDSDTSPLNSPTTPLPPLRSSQLRTRSLTSICP